METVLRAALAGAAIGAVVGFLIGMLLLVVRLVLPARKCPGCGELLPKVSWPANFRQAMTGRRNCPKCRCTVDNRGRQVGGG